MSDNEYWLVAVPGDVTPEDSWRVVSEKVKNHAGCFKFSIPELKVYFHNYINMCVYTQKPLPVSVGCICRYGT